MAELEKLGHRYRVALRYVRSLLATNRGKVWLGSCGDGGPVAYTRSSVTACTTCLLVLETLLCFLNLVGALPLWLRALPNAASESGGNER